MCGICGYISSKHIDSVYFERINNLMSHRGPDDEGIWQGESGLQKIGLGHRRLSILDLSELGHQPMLSADNKWIIVFNGEIYNYRELRAELQKKGHIFKTNCDTEVILEAFSEWDTEAINKLNGMFAFCIVNLENGTAYLARDRMGKKPLYYYLQNGVFVFASELKVIASFPGFHKKINMDALEKYLCYQYIAAPDCIYDGVYKLEAGYYLKYVNNSIEKIQYWDVLSIFKKQIQDQVSDYDLCKKELKNLLYESVQKRLVADVPVGTFLSGGIDSTLITAIANDIKSGGIETFTIGFDDETRNEAPFAMETAKLLGTKHNELYITEPEMIQMVDQISYFFDEPFADPSEIPTMLISKLAKENVTVALSGDGGDELFCGYSMYDYLYYAEKLDKVAGMANMLLTNKVGNRIKKSLPLEAVALLENRNVCFKTQLFADLPAKFVARMLDKKNIDVKYAVEENIDISNWQERRMLVDTYTYLPENCLTKSDRASMKYSLEIRCPLLDPQVVMFSYRIPHEFKYYKSDKKHILKDLTYEFVPREKMDRPKNGFGVPLGKWLRKVYREEIEKFSTEEYILRQGIFNYKIIRELITKVNRSDRKPYPKILWAYYIFQLWYCENF